MSSNDCITTAIPINNNPSQNAMDRRGSVGNAVFSNLFRSNSLSTHTTSIPETHRRRLSSVSVGLHQSGIVPPSTTPANFTLGPGHLRRTSTISLLDENAIEDDEMPSPLSGRSPPLSSISSRRASFARPRTVTGTASPLLSLSPTSLSPNSSSLALDDPTLTLDQHTNTKSTSSASLASEEHRQSGPRRRRDSENSMQTNSYLAGAVRRLSISGPAAAKAAREAAVSAPRKNSLPSTQSAVLPSSNPSFASRLTDQQQQQQQHFTWADQLRSRAEGRSSTFVSGSPPRVSSYGPSSAMATSPSQQTHFHRRESSVSADAMPPFQNPASATASAPRPKPRQKPDAFQERILKGDFYMD
ncbi:hypothetical protein Cpir12675_004992 [Ceratocystis pirilliformis]|uniref:Uncharacterized protein n=1 Tax=Ceratocystis pirilliformis TaxID=259994 RepID=A0ABR3YTQ7_9PEZI